jgi:hypothetical protein
VPENLWWDELAKLILNPATRQEEVSLSLNGNHYVYTFPPETGDSGGPDPHNKWRAWDIDGCDLVVDVTSLDAGEGHNDSYACAAPYKLPLATGNKTGERWSETSTIRCLKQAKVSKALIPIR